jgi:hypothetical protein
MTITSDQDRWDVVQEAVLTALSDLVSALRSAKEK